MNKSKLTAAFKDLRKAGYFARQNFLCCQSCGWAAMTEEQSNKAVFYHGQDNDDLKETGTCYLVWSGDGKEIVAILKKHGVKVEWEGSEDKRIKIDINE